jgi:hypothetical protein
MKKSKHIESLTLSGGLSANNGVQVFDSGLIRHYPDSFGYFKKVKKYKAKTENYAKMLKSLEKKEEMYTRNNSNIGTMSPVVTNRSTHNEHLEHSASSKKGLSKKATMRHLIPKKFKSKQSSPLPFIYDRLNK